MSTKICYLLGAGDSCDKLPLASKLGETILQLVKIIQNNIGTHNKKQSISLSDVNKQPWPNGIYARNLLSSFEWLGNYSRDSATVDTIARKLWIRSDEEAKKQLLSLKAVISCYFLYKQSKVPAGIRYDSFFSYILERGNPGEPLFPENISILTWNYDLALEKSYFEFCKNIDTVAKDIILNPKVVRLNGCAGYVRPVYAGVNHSEYDFYPNFIYQKNGIQIDKLIELFDRFFTQTKEDKLKPEIYFAWENTTAVELASKAIADAEVLVIIGYSFPFFNQNIDRQILDSAVLLKDIYIQNGNDPGSIERLKLLLENHSHSDGADWNEHVHIKTDTKMFFIPNEFIMQ